MPCVIRRLAALAAAVFVAGCASPFPPAAAPVTSIAPPQLDGSERWVYEQINPYNDLRVRTLTDTVEKGPHGYRVVRRSDRPRDPLEVKFLARPWSLAAQKSNEALQEYTPPLTVIPFPIAPGTHWMETLRSVDERGEVRRQQTWGRALDWERVSTPAGEFVALRIERDRNLGDHDVFWHDTYTHETLWYAPAVKRWVRREWRSRRQEVGFDPRIAIDAKLWQLLSYRK